MWTKYKILIIKWIVKNCILQKPTAETVSGWEDWAKNAKDNSPIAYFTQEYLPNKLHSLWVVHVGWPIRDWYWKLRHTFIPKDQYHIIKPPTLKAGYHDCDIRILHAVMGEVTNFYETGCNYEEWRQSSDAHAHAYNEIERVYNWWNDLWPHREEKDIWGNDIPEYPEFPEHWGYMAPVNDKYKNTPEVKDWSRISEIHLNSEKEWSDMEQEMLCRIMEIRPFMWH